jgi:uncharacterized protein DUF87
MEELTSDDLDYVQRTGFEPPRLGGVPPASVVPDALRSCVRVTGVGRLDKERHPHPASANPDTAPVPATADLLVTLHTHRVPVAFLVDGTPGRVGIRVGTWLPRGGSPATVAANTDVVETGLRSLFPAVDLRREGPEAGRTAWATSSPWQCGGLVLGLPTWKPPDHLDPVVPLDKLLRAMVGTRWAALVLAQPVEEMAVRELRLRLVNEMRATETAARTAGLASALAEHYLQLLQAQLQNLTEGQGLGAWRTAVYLLGDDVSYWRLAGLWRGLWSGRRSLPEPVRVFDRDEAPALAGAWALPEPGPQPPAPGHYRHPFAHQTLLSSGQLAAYVDFPTVETTGFAIRQVPDFDTVPPRLPAPDERPLVVGTVVERDQVTTTPYGVPLDALTRHAFVTGVTGAGKTNTLFHLLHQTAAAGVPFLVLEPAKTEYRVLLRHPELGRHLRVLTLGNEAVSPFRLNPFEVPAGIPVAVHLDLLRSVFGVAFGMWAPLPQLLEEALHELYRDWGWDVTADTNRRIGPDGEGRADAFPTLTDLLHKTEEVVARQRYAGEVDSNIRAALRTRLNSLRTGGKGRMLDVRRSLPLGPLLGHPTVAELEGLGDDDDKAFVMGLLMIRIAEYRRTQGDVDGLSHLLVIEEAHRLLTNPGPRGEGEGDAKGKAVETFANLLSEVRAYGQGVLVVDQVPTKLAPDVVKNTNLKIAHRVVAGDDREVLGAAMAMDERQARAVGSLPLGRAAVFADGEDAPLLVQVPPTKGGSGTWPDDAEVREAMASRRGEPLDGGLTVGSSDCDRRCLDVPEACEAARKLTDDARVRRLLGRVLLSAVLTPDGLARTWPDVEALVSTRKPGWVDEAALLRCLALHGSRRLATLRGARAGWSYQQTATVARLADALLTAHLAGADVAVATDQLRDGLTVLRGQRHGPFPHCRAIWGSDPRACLCHHPVAELVADGLFATSWDESRAADRQADGFGSTWGVCETAAFHLVELPDEDRPTSYDGALLQAARCTALCVAQQMLITERQSHPALERRVMAALFAEVGLPMPSTAASTNGSGGSGPAGAATGNGAEDHDDGRRVDGDGNASAAAGDDGRGTVY